MGLMSVCLKVRMHYIFSIFKNNLILDESINFNLLESIINIQL